MSDNTHCKRCRRAILSEEETADLLRRRLLMMPAHADPKLRLQHARGIAQKAIRALLRVCDQCYLEMQAEVHEVPE